MRFYVLNHICSPTVTASMLYRSELSCALALLNHDDKHNNDIAQKIECMDVGKSDGRRLCDRVLRNSDCSYHVTQKNLMIFVFFFQLKNRNSDAISSLTPSPNHTLTHRVHRAHTQQTKHESSRFASLGWSREFHIGGQLRIRQSRYKTCTYSLIVVRCNNNTNKPSLFPLIPPHSCPLNYFIVCSKPEGRLRESEESRYCF